MHDGEQPPQGCRDLLRAELEELVRRSACDIPRRVVGAEEVHGHSQQPGTASGGGVHALGLLGLFCGMVP